MHTKSIIAAAIGVAGIANALPAIKRAEQGEQGWDGNGGALGGNLGEAIGDIVDAAVKHGDHDDWRGSRLDRYGGGRCDPRYDDCGGPRWHSRPNDYNDDDRSWKRDAPADESQLRQYRPQRTGDGQWGSQRTGGRQWSPQQNRRPEQDGDDCQAQCIQYCPTFLKDEAPECAQQCPHSCNQINSQSIVDPKGHASSDEAFCAIFDQYSEDGDMSTNRFDGGDQNGSSQWQKIQDGGRAGRQSLSSNQVQDQDDDDDDDSNRKRDLPVLSLLNGLGGGVRQNQESEQYVDNDGYGSGRGHDTGRYKSSGYEPNSYDTGSVNNLENNHVQDSEGGGSLNPLSSLTSVGGGLTEGRIKKRQNLAGLSLLNGIGGGGVQKQESTQTVDNDGFAFNPESELENNQVQKSTGGGVLNPLSSVTSLGSGSGGGIIKRQGDLGGVVGDQRQRQQQNIRQTAGDNSELDNTRPANQDIDSTQRDSSDEDENDFGSQRIGASQVDAYDRGSQGGIGRQSTGGPNRGLNNNGRTSGFQPGSFPTSGAERRGVVGGTPQDSKCPLWVQSQQ